MTDKQLKKIILKEIKSILNEQVAVEVEYHSMAAACAELRTTLTKAKSSRYATEQQALLEKAMQSVIYIQQQVNQGWSEMKKKSEANKQAQATKPLKYGDHD